MAVEEQEGKCAKVKLASGTEASHKGRRSELRRRPFEVFQVMIVFAINPFSERGVAVGFHISRML